MSKNFEVDNNLSFAARGILSFLLKRESKLGYLPLSDFLINESQKSSTPLTKKQVKHILAELVNNGYAITENMEDFTFHSKKEICNAVETDKRT